MCICMSMHVRNHLSPSHVYEYVYVNPPSHSISVEVRRVIYDDLVRLSFQVHIIVKYNNMVWFSLAYHPNLTRRSHTLLDGFLSIQPYFKLT